MSKRKIAFLSMILALLLTASGCVPRNDIQQSSQPSSQQTSGIEEAAPDENELQSMREYALTFAEAFSSPFASVDELDPGILGRFSMMQLYLAHEKDLETDDAGYPYIPNTMLQEYMSSRFGLDHYTYPEQQSEKYTTLPQYNADKDAYLFGAAGDGSLVSAEIIEEVIEGQTATYTMRMERQDFETGNVAETFEMDYSFVLISTEHGYALQAVNACVPHTLPEQSEGLEDPPSAGGSPASSEPTEEEPEFVPLDVGVLGHTADNGMLQTTPAADGDALMSEVVYNLPETWKICVYDPQREGYVVHYYHFDGEDTAGQLVKAALQYLFSPEDGLDVASVQVRKTMAIAELQLTAGSFAEKTLQDKTAVEAVLHSLGATLRSNGFENTGFLLNGGQLSLGGVVLEDDGYGRWEPVGLYNQPISEEEFAGLRRMLPYPGHQNLRTPPALASNVKIQTEYPELYTLIYYAGDVGEYASHTEIENEKKAAVGIRTAPDTYECSNEPEKYPLYPADDSFLTPLFQSVLDFQFTPQEWVEEAVKSIWGSEAAIEHGDADIYTYHPKEGVYTPPHRGGGMYTEPYFHSIEETEDGFSTEVSYFVTSLPGVYVPSEEEWIGVYENFEEDPRVQELLSEKLPRYRITAGRGEDGKLILLSSELAA